jgi:hypothetical protein
MDMPNSCAEGLAFFLAVLHVRQPLRELRWDRRLRPTGKVASAVMLTFPSPGEVVEIGQWQFRSVLLRSMML